MKKVRTYRLKWTGWGGAQQEHRAGSSLLPAPWAVNTVYRQKIQPDEYNHNDVMTSSPRGINLWTLAQWERWAVVLAEWRCWFCIWTTSQFTLRGRASLWDQICANPTGSAGVEASYMTNYFPNRMSLWRHSTLCWNAINNVHPNVLHTFIFLMSRYVTLSVVGYIKIKSSVSNGVICIMNGSKAPFVHRCSNESLISCFCLSLKYFPPRPSFIL